MQVKTFVFNPIEENTYLLIDEQSKACIIIDAGCLYGRERLTLENYIKEQGLSLKRVINTHLHLDHCFGNKFLADTFGVLPEAGERDEFLLALMKHHAQMFGFRDEVEPQKLKGYLKDGDIITEGSIELHVLEVPGHSPGGLAFYSSKDKCVFCGDTLFQCGIGRTDLDGGNYSSLIDSIKSKLFSLPDDTTVYTGHGGTTNIGFEKDNNPYITAEP